MRLRVILALLALLAALLIVGFTTDAGAWDKIGAIADELAQTAEDQTGLSCTATPAKGSDDGLLVITIVCQQKVEAEG